MRENAVNCRCDYVCTDRQLGAGDCSDSGQNHENGSQRVTSMNGSHFIRELTLTMQPSQDGPPRAIVPQQKPHVSCHAVKQVSIAPIALTQMTLHLVLTLVP